MKLDTSSFSAPVSQGSIADSHCTMDPVHEDSDEETGEELSTDKDEEPRGGDGNSGIEGIAEKENRMVNYSKILVVVVIFVVAACIGAITYMFVRSWVGAERLQETGTFHHSP